MSTTFTLDTSGHVKGYVRDFWPADEKTPQIMPGRYTAPNEWSVAWTDLDPFTQGYVEALLAFAASGPAIPHGWYVDPNEARARFRDLAPETLQRILTDCAARLAQATPPYPNTREEGARTWIRRQAGKLKLHGFPPLTPYLGDDGKVYLREGTA